MTSVCVFIPALMRVNNITESISKAAISNTDVRGNLQVGNSLICFIKQFICSLSLSLLGLQVTRTAFLDQLYPEHHQRAFRSLYFQGCYYKLSHSGQIVLEKSEI